MIKIFPAIKDGINFFRTLSNRKVVNYLRLVCTYYYSSLVRKPVHRGLPASISLEPTTSCNLRCPECPSGLRSFSRPTGILPSEKFKDYIDELKGQLIYLLMYFQGEPLLNKAFYDMVRYAKKRNIYTATSTNAILLTDENARKTVESGLHRLIISIDGTSQETYEKYRREGVLEEAIAGVQNIVKWKHQLRSATPYVIIQFLVMKHNEHQIPEIKALAKKLGVDKLELKTVQVYDYESGSELIPDNQKYSRYKQTLEGSWVLKKPIKNKCFRMWSGAVVTWDGRVVPCCFDKDATHQMGSMETSSLKEIWQGAAYQSFRKQLIENRKRIEICRNCTE